jgi:enoyl-CoA hydratase
MMACDIILASTTAKIGQPEINLGIHPGFGGTQRLPRLVGNIKAKELLLTGDAIDAAEAYRIGLVNKVVEPEKLMEEAEKLAQKIMTKSGVQTNAIKELINKGTNVDLLSACALEIASFSASFATEDQKEGMSAFLEKRKPVFKTR